MLKISSLNVNGIRAAHRHGFTDWIDQTDPDIICLQELRAMEHQVPGPVQKLDYHEAYHTAEKKGYSGVGILSKQEPIRIKKGMGVDWIDSEGRVMMAEFKNLYVFSVYAPSGTTGDDRQDLKMEFLDYFLPFAQKFLSKEKPIVMCGDYNICHKPIDIHDPVRNAKNSGFLPEEREWIGQFIDSGFIDTFRYFNPEPHNYTWWSYRANARAKNLGWRIDYHMVTESLEKKLHRALILPEAMHSDHCPISLEIDF